MARTRTGQHSGARQVSTTTGAEASADPKNMSIRVTRSQSREPVQGDAIRSQQRATQGTCYYDSPVHCLNCLGTSCNWIAPMRSGRRDPLVASSRRHTSSFLPMLFMSRSQALRSTVQSTHKRISLGLRQAFVLCALNTGSERLKRSQNIRVRVRVITRFIDRVRVMQGMGLGFDTSLFTLANVELQRKTYFSRRHPRRRDWTFERH